MARVKRAVAIPVLGSGSIRTAADAIRLLRESGADGVAISRGCFGNPWIFAQARAALDVRQGDAGAHARRAASRPCCG